MRLALALALMPSFVAVQVLAQDWDCTDWSSLPQQGLNACAYQDWQDADASLNAAYSAVMVILGSSPEADTLREAQRAWITYRDKACEVAAAPMRGGSAEPLLRNGCLARLTERRAQDLWDFTEMF